MVYFLGKTTSEDVLKMQLTVNGNCANLHWQECLNPACEKHNKELTCYRFKESFLGKS
jgi:hypothetical protein